MTSKKLKQSGELIKDKDDIKTSKSVKTSEGIKSSKKLKKSLEVENSDDLSTLESFKTPTDILNETDNIFIFDKINKPKQKLKSTKMSIKQKKTKTPKIEKSKRTSIYNWDEHNQEQLNPDLTELEADFLATDDSWADFPLTDEEDNYTLPDDKYTSTSPERLNNPTSPEEASGSFPSWDMSDSIETYDVSNHVENELDHSNIDYNSITDPSESLDVILSQQKKKFKFSNLFKKNKSGEKSKKNKSKKKSHKSTSTEGEIIPPTESVEYQLSDLMLVDNNLDDKIISDTTNKIENESTPSEDVESYLFANYYDLTEQEKMSKHSGEDLEISESGEDTLNIHSGEDYSNDSIDEDEIPESVNEDNTSKYSSEISQPTTEVLDDIELSENLTASIQIEEFSSDSENIKESHTTESDDWNMSVPVVDDSNSGLAENHFADDKDELLVGGVETQQTENKPQLEIKPVMESPQPNRLRPVYIDIGQIVAMIEKNRPISEALQNVNSENIRDVIKLIKPKLKPAFKSKLDNYLATSPELDMPLVEFRDRLAYYSEHFSNILPPTIEGIIEMIETVYQVDYNEISLWIQKLDKSKISFSTAIDFWLQVTTVYPTMLFGMNQIPLTIFHRGNVGMWQDLTKVKMMTHDIETGEDGQFMTVWNACPVEVKFVEKHSVDVDSTIDNLMRYKLKILSKSNEPFLLFDREISPRIFNVDFKVPNLIKYLFISDDPLNDISSKINNLSKFNNDWLVVGLRAFGESVDSNVVYNGNNLTSDCYHVSEFLEIPEELDEFFHIEVVR